MKTNNFLKCIVDDNRRSILSFLEDKERCVNEIVSTLHLEQSLVSHHLKLLKCCGLVDSRQDGKEIYYRLVDPTIYTVLKIIEDLSERLDLKGECNTNE
jgi:DNA-binding transcriptional ArsR family regulator